jgi:LacI family transcriptional regulator
LPGGRASYVGQDAQASGKLAAKLMRLLLTPATSPVVIQPVAEDVHIRGRVEGFLAGFAGEPGGAANRGESATPGRAANRGGKAGEPSIPLYVQPMADAVSARELVTRVFAEHPHAGGIFVTNALVHLVARALIDLGRADLPLVGYDVLPENRAFLETGAIDFLISQRPHLQGKRAITLLFEALQAGSGGGQAGAWPKREIMPLDMVTAENIQYYTDV